MVYVNDALAKVQRARDLQRELVGITQRWLDSGGIELQFKRDPDVCRDTWFIGMAVQPERPIEPIGSDIFHNLVSALDYVAFEVYLAGGGEYDSKEAGRIYFPIFDDEDAFNLGIARKAPKCWDETRAAFLMSQPFKQEDEAARQILPRLHRLNNATKHRELCLAAVGSIKIGGRKPALPPGYAWALLMARPGPTFKLGYGEPLGQTIVKEAGDHMIPLPRRALDVQIEEMPPPEFDLCLRGTHCNGFQVNRIPWVIEHIDKIVRRFDFLVPPRNPSGDTFSDG